MSGTTECVILGAGGHAKVLIETLRSASVHVVAALDADRRLWGQEVLGVPVVGDDAHLAEYMAKGRTFAVGVGSVGRSTIRCRLYEFATAQGFVPQTARHPTAIIFPSARLGAGCQIFAGAIVNVDARLGENVIVNTGAIVEHDCWVGSHVHIATGARLAGGVRIGAAAHVGIGASIREGTAIGDGAVVGAGAVVVADVPPSAVVAGVPARELLLSADLRKQS